MLSPEIVEAARFVANTNKHPPRSMSNLGRKREECGQDSRSIGEAERGPSRGPPNLGQAFLDQQKEVMDTIQIPPQQAQAAGTLKTSEQ